MLAATGCGGGGGTASTAPNRPDVLTVRIEGSGYPVFRLELSCAIADREACVAVVDALDDAAAAAECTPLDDDPSRILVSGRIDDEPVSSVLRRRTDCEARAYDRVIDALGL